MKKLAVITGASSGIGEATAYSLAQYGYNLGICARRMDKLSQVAAKCRELGADVVAVKTDVTSKSERQEFLMKIDEHFNRKIDVFFNNAGLALGTARFDGTSEQDLRQMFETNLFAPHALTTLALPSMDSNGHIIFMGSVAGHQAYEGGSGYCGSKHALRAMYESLRQECADSPVRMSMISPGLVETEFSKVRFKGDTEKANAVYDGIDALTAEDIAKCVRWIVTQPNHVNIGDIQIYPRHQADARKVHRKK